MNCGKLIVKSLGKYNNGLKQAYDEFVKTRSPHANLNFNFWSWPWLNFSKNRCSGSPAGSKKFARFRFGFDCFDCLKSCLDKCD